MCRLAKKDRQNVPTMDACTHWATHFLSYSFPSSWNSTKALPSRPVAVYYLLIRICECCRQSASRWRGGRWLEMRKRPSISSSHRPPRNPTFRSGGHDQRTEWTNLIMRQMIVSFAIELARERTRPLRLSSVSNTETGQNGNGGKSFFATTLPLRLMEDFLKSNSINVVKWHFNCMSSNQIPLCLLRVWLTWNCFWSAAEEGNYYLHFL